MAVAVRPLYNERGEREIETTKVTQPLPVINAKITHKTS